MYKVPFRQCYANSISDLVAQTFWCHVVRRVFPRAVDLDTDALADCYRGRPAMMYEQYASAMRPPMSS